MTDHAMSRFDTLLQMIAYAPADDATATTQLQLETETPIRELYEELLDRGSHNLPGLNKASHVRFVRHFLANKLPDGYKALDASHTWLLYWMVNALELLGEDLSPQYAQIADTLMTYGDDGLFGGGVGQLPHVASCYAGYMALAITGRNADKIDRQRVYAWLLELRKPDGSFRMHVDGETDTRAVYCALCVAYVLDILTPELTEGTAEWLQSCQTYEGGFGGTPNDEAHSGYTFCAVAALCILDTPARLAAHCDVDSLVSWIAMRQLPVEGGFQGRTNKLVDACYSHWTGGLVPLVEASNPAYFDRIVSREALENYILACCQDARGGLIDKPGKTPDFYHTNYALCGLSMCENRYECGAGLDFTATPLRPRTLTPIDPIFGIPNGRVQQFRAHFANST